MSSIIEKFKEHMSKIKGYNWIKDFEEKDIETKKMIEMLDREIEKVNYLNFNDKDVEDMLKVRISNKNIGNYEEFMKEIKRICKRGLSE